MKMLMRNSSKTWQDEVLSLHSGFPVERHAICTMTIRSFYTRKESCTTAGATLGGQEENVIATWRKVAMRQNYNQLTVRLDHSPSELRTCLTMKATTILLVTLVAGSVVSMNGDNSLARSFPSNLFK